MASGKQLKALLQSFANSDEAQFYAVAMQLAAHEAKLGHGKLAQELRVLIDKAKATRSIDSVTAVPLAKPRGELSGLLSVSYPKLTTADMVLASEVSRKLQRLIKEHKQIQKIRSHGLAPRKKLLLVGPPGTGKTLTASVLAGELGMPLFVVHLDTLVTKYLGETASKLRLIFDSIQRVKGVYLFDEFDSIGSHRRMDNDVGEIRRVLNSFLQMIEGENSDSILIAATNHVDLLDHALFRRFDDVIEYKLPEIKETKEALQSKLGRYASNDLNFDEVAKLAEGLSFGDLTRACENAIKEAVVESKQDVSLHGLSAAIQEQQNIRRR